MPARTRVLAILALALILGAGSPGANDATPPPAPTTAPSTAPDAATLAARAWWNRPTYVAALQLSEAQRQQMDAALVAHLNTRREAARAYFVTRRQLGEELAVGDWKAADRTAEDAAQIFASMSRSEGDLAIAVARTLTPEQRTKLDAEHPALLRRPLIQGGLGMREGRRGRVGRVNPSGK